MKVSTYERRWHVFRTFVLAEREHLTLLRTFPPALATFPHCTFLKRSHLDFGSNMNFELTFMIR